MKYNAVDLSLSTETRSEVEAGKLKSLVWGGGVKRHDFYFANFVKKYLTRYMLVTWYVD